MKSLFRSLLGLVFYFFSLFSLLQSPDNNIKEGNPLCCTFPHYGGDEPVSPTLSFWEGVGGAWQRVCCPGWQCASPELLQASGLSHVRLGRGSEGSELGKRKGLFLQKAKLLSWSDFRPVKVLQGF